MSNTRRIDFKKLKQAVSIKSKLDIAGHTNQQGGHIGYGMAFIFIPNPYLWEGVVQFRLEGESQKSDETTTIPDVENWWDMLVDLCVEVLLTGRTCEVGKGINLRKWQFSVHGQPCDYPWDYLVKDLKDSNRDVPWDLNPDYQRGSVWNIDQQEKFIGHCLSGGAQPLIYVQRHDRADHAPKGTNYWELPIEVIDGQQRLRAIRAFIDGDIGALVYHDGQWHRHLYADLDEVERRNHHLSSKVMFVDISREDRLRFYLRLNSGIAHTEEELDRVRQMLVAEYGEAE